MVKISQNDEKLANVYLVHLKVEHCQTLHVVSGQNDSKNQSEMPLCAHLGQQTKQAVFWFWPL